MPHACTIKLRKQPYGAKFCSEVLETTGCTSSCHCCIPCVRSFTTLSGLPLGQPCPPITKVRLSYRTSVIQVALSKMSLKKKRRMRLLVMGGEAQCCSRNPNLDAGLQAWSSQLRTGRIISLDLLVFFAARVYCWLTFSLLSPGTLGFFSSELFKSISPRLHSCAGLFLPSSWTLDLLLMNFLKLLSIPFSSLSKSLGIAAAPSNLV